MTDEALPKKPRKPDPGRVQRQASDPAVSAWVTASAGTGKTKVLTDRVLRLMLAGAKPDEILCLTFTRAAAAVMTIRIREELSLWATCPDDVLQKRLRSLTGDKPEADDIAGARQLFAKFLDAHGGLRIQTIHSFAQDLIRRFPVETGIPPYFDIMDDQTAADLLRQAQADVLRNTQENPQTALARAVQMVTPEVSEDDFAALIGELTFRRGELITLIDRDGGIENTINKAYAYLHADPKADQKILLAQLNSNFGLNGRAPQIADLEQAAEILATGSAADLEKATTIKSWLMNPEQRTEIYKDYCSVFLTKEGTPRKKMTSNAATSAEQALRDEASRLIAGDEIIRTQNVARGTESILRLTDAILERYTARKKALNLLDFDDLVYRSNVMMRKDGASAWALKKLPGDLKHVLIDEAQDTNPDQWQLVASLVDEFFNKPLPITTKKNKIADKTLFVVGDEKQSIFSFQRADPAEFARRRKSFSAKVKAAGGKWRDVSMDIAFRSSPAVTETVDAVFAQKEAADGLFSDDTPERKVRHDPYRRGQAGRVELHPLLIAPTVTPTAPWQPPLTRQDAPDMAALMAEKIADQIKNWLDTAEELPSRKRPINPSDITILVRRRSDFVDHMVRALKKREIPVAGADRVSLSDQIVVQDLVALGEYLLFPDDDYKLACVLKSPLIGLDDLQLEKLAVGRTGSLRTELAVRATENSAYAAAESYLRQLALNLNNQKPYEFYSSVIVNGCPMHATSGVSAIYNRLGFEAEDPLVEFMNAIERFEKNHVPSLQGFLSWLSAGDAEVKREINLNPESPRVHIMTVHGAKGLEAPIVILPDTTGIPSDNNRARPRFLWPLGDRDIPLWVPKTDLENSIFTREREKMEQERDREFRRLMYVAMTRAADRLYIYGYSNSGILKPESWFALMQKGMIENLKDSLQIVPPPNAAADFNAAAAAPESNVLRFEAAQTAKPQPDFVKPLKKTVKAAIPYWALKTATSASAPLPIFRPSDAQGKHTAQPVSSPLEVRDDGYYRRLGTAVHRLFEVLPLLPVAEQKSAAASYLAQSVLALTPPDQETAIVQILTVLQHPDYAPIFTADARSEVSLSATVVKNGQPHHMSGQIDRLIVGDKTVTIVDFKNNLKIPAVVAEVNPDYVNQMAAYRLALQKIYPDKDVRCALLYTRAAKMIELPAPVMDQALQTMALSIAPSVAPKP